MRAVAWRTLGRPARNPWSLAPNDGVDASCVTSTIVARVLLVLQDERLQ
ncbi:hypothetical protein BH11PSE4_BH11PSE4_00340 [soil metagenome]